MIPYELKVCLLMFAIPYGVAMPWIIRWAWKEIVVPVFPKCVECGKPLYPLTGSEMNPHRHRHCQALVIIRLIGNPILRDYVIRELEEWKRR